MPLLADHKIKSAIFITFPGNCRMALAFYQSCFGGKVFFQSFGKLLPGLPSPVIAGSLVSDRIIIYGSDLVHDEGRNVGNCVAVFLSCEDVKERLLLMRKLSPERIPAKKNEEMKLVEVRDAFGVRWVLGVG